MFLHKIVCQKFWTPCEVVMYIKKCKQGFTFELVD